MMRIIILVLLLTTFPAVFAANDAYIHVTNPDSKKYAISWTGPAPNCTINDVRGQTNTWIYHYYGEHVQVYVKDILSNHVICTVDIDEENQAYMNVIVQGDDCYRVSPNGNINDINKTRSTWITTLDAPPYLVHNCGD